MNLLLFIIIVYKQMNKTPIDDIYYAEIAGDKVIKIKVNNPKKNKTRYLWFPDQNIETVTDIKQLILYAYKWKIDKKNPSIIYINIQSSKNNYKIEYIQGTVHTKNPEKCKKLKLFRKKSKCKHYTSSGSIRIPWRFLSKSNSFMFSHSYLKFACK